MRPTSRPSCGSSSPALIILTFGTNEGIASGRPRCGDYERRPWKRASTHLQGRQSPGASIVVRRADRTPSGCPTIAAAREPGAETRSVRSRCSAAEAQDYEPAAGSRASAACAVGTRRPASPWCAISSARSRPVPAPSSGTGPPCRAAPAAPTRWVQQGLEHRDHVHMTEGGYALSADRLHAALMRDYRRR